MATLPANPRSTSAGNAALGIPQIPAENFRGLESLYGKTGPPTNKEREEFTAAVDRYLAELRDWLVEFSAWRDEMAQLIRLGLRFENQGRVPCYGARVDLHFPDPFMPFDEDSAPPWPPGRPKFHRPSAFDKLLRHNLISPDLPTLRDFGNLGPEPNVSRPRYRKGSVHVEFEIQKILHGVPESSDTITVRAPGDGSFVIPWEILAENLGEPAWGELRLEIETKLEPTEPIRHLDEILAMIGQLDNGS